MGYFSQKTKHAFDCYSAGVPRKKVYAVVEKGDSFVVLKTRKGDKYKYALAGGTIEIGEDVQTAAKREILEELNIEAEFVKTLAVIRDKSQWTHEGFTFWVEDEMEIVYTKYVKDGSNTSYGIEGEFETQDIVCIVSKEDMLNGVAEFVHYGVKL